MAEYVKIYCCGDCVYYDRKKHKCKRGAKVDDGSCFFRDCPIGIHEEKDGDTGDKELFGNSEQLDDTISRRGTIVVLKSGLLDEDGVHVWRDVRNTTINAAIEVVEAMPSAQQWIPCKTAFPEKENTRVTYQTNAGVIIIDGIYGGIDAYGHRVWLDRECGLYWDDEVVAWMPVVIPKPWKGEPDEH